MLASMELKYTHLSEFGHDDRERTRLLPLVLNHRLRVTFGLGDALRILPRCILAMVVSVVPSFAGAIRHGQLGRDHAL
jgi:hypothetical protein